MSEALATTTPNNALAGYDPAQIEALRAAGIDIQDQTGKEGLTYSRPPFIKIAQKTSKEIDEAYKDVFIEGLKFLQLYVQGTQINLGQGPVSFIPLGLKRHAIEWIPRDEGGGIKDRNVPWDDPRCKWGKDGEEPVATRILDWVVLLESGQVGVISCSVTGLAAGEKLESLIKANPLPIYTLKFSVEVIRKESTDGPYGKFLFKGTGLASPEQAKQAQALVKDIAKIKDKIDHEGAEEDVVDGEVVDAPKGDVPF